MRSIVGNDNHKRTHVLVVPFITEGHTTAMLSLATQLGRMGVIITFVSTEDSISRFTSADGVGSSSELQGLDFRFVAMPSLKQGKGVVLPPWVISWNLKEAFKPLTEKLIRDKSAGIPGPTILLSDLLLLWTQDVADQLEIPMYTCVSEGAIFPSLLRGVLPYFESGQLQISETDGKLVPFDWLVSVPGVPPLHYHQLPRSFREEPSEVRRRYAPLETSAGILVNSFSDLEGKVIEKWTSGGPGFDHVKVPRIYPVGPLLSPSIRNVSRPPDGLEDSASKCLLWLGSQPSSSVLYVAFGSVYRLALDQIHELAFGLEDSKQRFLWVLPQVKGRSEVETPSSLSEVLPQGFEARVGDRGCIVTGWVPQFQILAHSSTSAFLTHSGWNSTLESIACGVPMISCPQGAEQHLNSGFVVDDLEIAVKLETRAQNIMKRIEVQRAVQLLMVEPEGKEIRSRAQELQKKAAAAVADGGSRSRILQQWLDDLQRPES